MLRERRNCFRGRCSGFDGLRMCPTIGEPAERRVPARPEKGCLNRGGPVGSGAGECADCGRFSPWGEDAKHSSADINGGWGTEEPLPNLKAGHSARADFSETAVVVNPLVLDSDGRINEGLRRLEVCQFKQCIPHSLADSRLRCWLLYTLHQRTPHSFHHDWLVLFHWGCLRRWLDVGSYEARCFVRKWRHVHRVVSWAR